MLTLLAMSVAAVPASPDLAAARPMPGWLHAASDLATVLGCLTVLGVFGAVLLRRRDLVDGRTAAMLGGFLLALAATHLVHLVVVAGLASRPADAVAAGAAVVSAGAALGLWLCLPRLLRLPNPILLARQVELHREAERRALASEARAREAEARMAAFLGHLPDALFVLHVGADGALRVEAVNPSFEQIFGVPAARVADAPAEALLPAALAGPVVARWRQVATNGAVAEEEMTAELAAGQRVLQTVLVPMRGPDGQVERLLGSVRDVTATRRLQQGMVQSARLATVGTICAGLAHEASQPLNVASLWLRRARAAAEDVPDALRAPIARAAQIVESQLHRAGDLIARIRALAGEEARDAASFDAAGAVAAALRIAATRYAAEGITLALRGAAAPLQARGSAARLEQAVLHLLSNARDAVLERRRKDPLAPACIEVVLRHEAGAQMGRIAIEVRDSGTGVADALAGAIFDPFFTTKEPGCGTGLGLSFAAGVARAMGGGIETWNLPGGGACFRMDLAAIPSAGCPAQPHAA
ncbi:sensor histidine kinase [Falsiroseomonas sp.]|uniref:sensor histidine kinase n=1 Tax=Falsiroseomonas sp. TaxID=2870721 RepID=UPI0034A17D0B